MLFEPLIRWTTANGVRALSYSSLLLGYILLLTSADHSQSNKGLVLILECIPLVLLGIQILYPLKVIWFFLAVIAGLYGILIGVAVAGVGVWSSDDLHKLLG